MSRFKTLAAACCFALAVIVAQPVNAATPRERYQTVYERVDAHNAGPYGGVAGRNIADDGLNNGHAASADQLRAGIAVMRRMLHPPVAKPAATPETTAPASTSSVPAPTTTSTASSGGYSIPSYIVDCESGGDYGAQNASGAYGAYQIMPSTAAAYGCDLSSASGQDACAAEIYADVGASAWACG